MVITTLVSVFFFFHFMQSFASNLLSDPSLDVQLDTFYLEKQGLSS